MSARYTAKEAAKLTIIENRVKLRPTMREAIAQAELEQLKKQSFRAKSAVKNEYGGITTVLVKPLSVNSAWRGRRFKTPLYTSYEQRVKMLLPKMDVPDGALKVTYEFGFSSRACDVDNPAKLITDILSKKYGFNDKMIFEMILKKTIVKKGKEYFTFLIESAY